MKKRIAIIIPGGIGVGHFSQGIPILECFLERLAEKHDVTVFPLGRVDAGYVPRGFKLLPIREDYSRPLIVRAFKSSLLIARVHFRQRFAVFHGIWTFPSGFLAALFGKVFRVKSVISLQGGGIAKIEEINYGGRMRRPVERCILWSLRRADALTAESDFQRNLIPDAALRERVSVIPYGVDLHLFKYVRRDMRPPYQFIHIANINPVKDQMTLLRCFQILSKEIDCRLTLVGPDYLQGRLQRFVREEQLTDKVSFTGPLRHGEIPARLQGAHIMLHTSLHEGMPLAVVEAMASGVAVCGTRVGIMADLSPGCCVAVSVKDHESLAREVLSLLRDTVRFETLLENARRWTEEHDIDWTADRFDELYGKFIDAR